MSAGTSIAAIGRWRKRLDKWATAIMRVLRLASPGSAPWWSAGRSSPACWT